MSLIHYCKTQPDAFSEAFNDSFFLGSLFPALDVAEDKDKYTITADLPGLTKEHIKVDFEDGILTISGERKYDSEQKEKNYHRLERSYGRFSRSLNLGHGVDANGIKATYKDGVLEVLVPKQEKAKVRPIDIQVS